MIGKAPKVIQQQRLNICHMCPEYFQMTNMCLKCACVVPLKVKFLKAKCPLHKWGNGSKQMREKENNG
jgi:hypothetical protein